MERPRLRAVGWHRKVCGMSGQMGDGRERFVDLGKSQEDQLECYSTSIPATHYRSVVLPWFGSNRRLESTETFYQRYNFTSVRTLK